MKYLSIILLLFIFSCRTSSNLKSDCKDFEEDVRTNWKKPEGKRVYYFTSDSLVKGLTGKYRNCIIGKDSSDIIKILGKKYGLMAPLCYDSARHSMNLKVALEYIIQTPLRDGSSQGLCGYSLVIAIDSLNKARCITLQDFNCVGYK